VTEAADITIEKYNQLVEWLGKPGQNVVFIYNIDSPQEKSKNDLKAIGNLLLLTGHLEKEGSGIILTREYANSAGVSEMGVTPGYLPGFVKPSETAEIERIGKLWNTGLANVFKPVNLEEKLLKGEIKAMLVFGEDPLVEGDNRKYFKDVQFLAVMDMFKTETAGEADVVLPAASFIEQGGTYTACDRRVQEVKPVMEPKNGMENWRIIQKLAQKFVEGFAYDSVSGVTAEIQTVNRTQGEKGKPAYAVYETDTTTLNPELPTLLYSENYYKTKIKDQLMR
ncbi:MAG: molybdopterin-dependent oxidoreductase, partial [bacterium]|nr:molybdopterin-dependent oxidoreductase [bacterium]